MKSPYNYQVNLLRAALGDQAKIGNIDKFQGQEAHPLLFCPCVPLMQPIARVVLIFYF